MDTTQLTSGVRQLTNLECVDDEVKEPLHLRGVRVQQHQVGGAGLLQHGPDQLAKID
jgi:hypothetical protein